MYRRPANGLSKNSSMAMMFLLHLPDEIESISDKSLPIKNESLIKDKPFLKMSSNAITTKIAIINLKIM